MPDDIKISFNVLSWPLMKILEQGLEMFHLAGLICFYFCQLQGEKPK
jgi:hypothetical protein